MMESTQNCQYFYNMVSSNLFKLVPLAYSEARASLSLSSIRNFKKMSCRYLTQDFELQIVG